MSYLRPRSTMRFIPRTSVFCPRNLLSATRPRPTNGRSLALKNQQQFLRSSLVAQDSLRSARDDKGSRSVLATCFAPSGRIITVYRTDNSSRDHYPIVIYCWPGAFPRRCRLGYDDSHTVRVDAKGRSGGRATALPGFVRRVAQSRQARARAQLRIGIARRNDGAPRSVPQHVGAREDFV